MKVDKEEYEKFHIPADVKYMVILSKDLEIIKVLSAKIIEIDGEKYFCIFTNADEAGE